MQRITSRHNAIVARFRAVAKGDSRECLLLDGLHLVADARSSGVALEVVAVTAEAESRPEVASLVAELSRDGVDLVQVAAPVLDAMTPVKSATGIVALGRRPRADLSACFTTAAPLVVVAVEIQDPGNLGAIVRVAEAAGATGLVATAGSADPHGWKALRGSMGSALRLPIARCGSPADALAAARAHGCAVVATMPRGGRPFTDASLDGPLAILVGGEGAGLPVSVVDAADERVTIPMRSPVESLNAAVTAALLVYEARRQRSAMASAGQRSAKASAEPREVRRARGGR